MISLNTENKHQAFLLSILGVALLLRAFQIIAHPFVISWSYYKTLPVTPIIYKLAFFLMGGTYEDFVYNNPASVLAVNAISTIFEMMAIYYTYKLAALYNKDVGLISAFILATNPWFMVSIGYIEAPIVVGLTTAYLYYFIRGVDTNNLKYYFMGSLFLIINMFTKGFEGLIPLPALLFYALVKNRKSIMRLGVASATVISIGLMWNAFEITRYGRIKGLIGWILSTKGIGVRGSEEKYETLFQTIQQNEVPVHPFAVAFLLSILRFFDNFLFHATHFGSLLFILLYGLLRNAKHWRNPLAGFTLIWFLLMPLPFLTMYPYFLGDMPEYHFLGTFPPFAIITGTALYEVFKEGKNRFITVFSLNVGFAVYSWSKYAVLPVGYGVLGALFSGLFIIALYPVLTSQLGMKLENLLGTQQLYQKSIFFFFFLVLTFLAIKVRILNYLT